MFISVFSDELGLDVTKAVPIISSWGVKHVDFRGMVYGKGIEALSDEQLKDLRTLVDDNGMSVGCLQTSLCKVHLPDDERQKKEAEKLEGIIRAADALDCRLVRSFHYWQPGKKTKEEPGQMAIQPDVRQRVLDMFGPIADRAKEAGLIMAFENCGVLPDEVFALLNALNVPEWGMAWDAANTWDCEERQKDEDSFIERMVKNSKCVHVKAGGSVEGVKRSPLPYGKIMQVCHSMGMTGPVSAETHNPDKSVSDEDRTHQVIEAIRSAWPAAAPQSAPKKEESVIREWADDPVGFLVVGLGMGHENCKKVQRASGCKLIAVADLREERAERSGKEFDVPYGTDFRKLLEDDKVEVVYVVTETGNHATIGIEALEAGKHVLTTKPMEATVDACDQMIRLAEEKGLLLAVDFGKRFGESTLTMKQNLQDGMLGRLLSGECSTKILRTMDYFRQNGGWRGTKKLDGGGVLSNQNIHHIDELVFSLGVPAKVRANVWTQNHEIEAEDLGVAAWLYDSGLVINLHATTCYPQPTWYVRIELTGEKGAMYHVGGGPYSKQESKWYVDGAWTDKAPTVVKSEWVNAADNMAAAIRTGAPLVCDGRDGRRSQAVLGAMYRSAYDNDGEWTEVNAEL